MNNFEATTPQLRACKKYTEAILSCDIKGVQSAIAKNYTFQTFPKVSEASGKTETSIERHRRILSTLTKIEPNIHEVIEAPGKVVIHAAAMCFIGDTRVDYDTLCIITLTEEDGELKVLNVKNFTDPQHVHALDSAVARVHDRGGPAA